LRCLLLLSPSASSASPAVRSSSYLFSFPLRVPCGAPLPRSLPLDDLGRDQRGAGAHRNALRHDQEIASGIEGSGVPDDQTIEDDRATVVRADRADIAEI